MAASLPLLCSQISSASSALDVLSLAGERLTSSSPKERIRKAYLKLVALTHPDKVSVPEAKSAFQKVTWAYRSLCDPQSINQSDGWQEDTKYQKVKKYTGQWYQDDEGKWYTEWDYKDQDGQWHRRTAKEMEIMCRVKKHGLECLKSQQELLIYQQVYATLQVMAQMQAKKRQGAHPPSPRNNAQQTTSSGEHRTRPSSANQHGSTFNPRTDYTQQQAKDVPSSFTGTADTQHIAAQGRNSYCPGSQSTPPPSISLAPKGYAQTRTAAWAIPVDTRSLKSKSTEDERVNQVIDKEKTRREVLNNATVQTIEQTQETLEKIRQKVELHKEATERRAVDVELNLSRRKESELYGLPLTALPKAFSDDLAEKTRVLPDPKALATMEQEHARRQKDQERFMQQLAQTQEELYEIRKKAEMQKEAAEHRKADMDSYLLRRKEAELERAYGAPLFPSLDDFDKHDNDGHKMASAKLVNGTSDCSHKTGQRDEANSLQAMKQFQKELVTHPVPVGRSPNSSFASNPSLAFLSPERPTPTSISKPPVAMTPLAFAAPIRTPPPTTSTPPRSPLHLKVPPSPLLFTSSTTVAKGHTWSTVIPKPSAPSAVPIVSVTQPAAVPAPVPVTMVTPQRSFTTSGTIPLVPSSVTQHIVPVR